MDLEDEKRFQQIIEQLFGESALEKEDLGKETNNNEENSFDFTDNSSHSSESLEEEELEIAVEMAKSELDCLREAFINFQQEIKGLVLLKYSTQFLLDYSSYCEELEKLLLSRDDSQEPDDSNNFIVEKDLRKQILIDIYEQYKGQNNEE